mgnify:CR=1 FL=1
MNKEKFDKLHELLDVTAVINPKLIDEKAFIEEVCEILSIQPPKYLSPYLPDLSKEVYIKLLHEDNNIPVGNCKPLEIRYEANEQIEDNYTPLEIKYESNSIYTDPSKLDSVAPDDCFKSTGVAEMKHVTTC